jgi:hypothetical protein
MPIVITNDATDLVRAYNLQRVQILTGPQENFNIDPTDRQDKPLFTGSLGTPVMANLVLKGDSYIDENGVTKVFDTVEFDTVLLTVNQTKNIKETQIQGRAGTIKEYIGLGDFEVTINTILTGTNGHFPIEDLTTVKNLLAAPISIKVTSWYLQLFDIDYIVIKSYDISQVEGAYSIQPLTINAASDNEVKIKVIPQTVIAALNAGLI